MALTQFRELDVKSMEQLYEKRERKRRQRAAQKRRHEREEQQQQQKQAQLPSTALATLLGQTVGVLGPTEAQTTSWTSADPFASIVNLQFDSGENLGIAETYTQCDFAPALDSLAPSCEIGGILSTIPKPTFSDDINSLSPFWLSCAPLPDQSATEQATRGEANPSSAEKLALVPDLARRATGQLRLTNPVISAMDASVIEVEDSSESSESCDAVETDDGRGSDDDETDVESCHQEMTVPGSELPEKDLSSSPVLHVLSESNSTAPNFPESPSITRDPFPSDSTEVPVGCLGGLKEPQTGDFSLPTPASDHASDSGQVGHIVTCRKKRRAESTEGGCESHELRPAKRMRPRKVDTGTISPALPPRNLRALPSRVLANSNKRLSNKIETQLRRSAGTPERSEAEDPIGLTPCGKDKLRPDTSFMHDLENTSKRSRCKEARQGRSRKISPVPSLRPNHLSRNHDHQTERCGLVLPPPINTTANPPVSTCHACGFSAKHLLRMINAFEALNGGSARLPDGERRMDMLELFLGFIKNYAMERLPHNETSTENNETYKAKHQDHAAEGAVGLSHSDTFDHDDGSDDDTEDNNDSQSDDESDGDSSDHCPSPEGFEENGKRPKRRRWTDWEEERLRVYIEEGKEWSWIAKRLHRSEPAVTQHWVIMERQDKETAK